MVRLYPVVLLRAPPPHNLGGTEPRTTSQTSPSCDATKVRQNHWGGQIFGDAHRNNAQKQIYPWWEGDVWWSAAGVVELPNRNHAQKHGSPRVPRRHDTPGLPRVGARSRASTRSSGAPCAASFLERCEVGFVTVIALSFGTHTTVPILPPSMWIWCARVLPSP
jgi:hypothetical protein